MKKFLRWLLFILVLAGIGYAAAVPMQAYLAKRNLVHWRTDKVVQGSIKSMVNSTGTVKPKLQVAVGSFVSGPVIELNVGFNQEVKAGDLLARIDPLLYEANVARDEASLRNREADVDRVRAQLQQARNDEKRAIALHLEDSSFIAQAEMDKFKFARLSLEAQLKSAITAVKQAEATLKNSAANLGYTEIRAKMDGMVIDRKINEGQTVAASFQTPELFIIAPDLRKEVHVYASVDEADIGQIKAAQVERYPVTFTVDAYPDELFEGHVDEVRLNFTTSQNVVTYPVIVAAPNPDLKLLPGMTASLSFQVAYRENVVKIPNAALRFYPDAKHVREEDLPILEGHTEKVREPDEDQPQSNSNLASAEERTQLRKQRDQRHVWVQEGAKLRAVAVVTGLSDSQYTELVEGELKPGEALVTGIQPPNVGASR
ncbi:efflux RND transporter periplasmic adaptor subunit [Schlesneria sp. DSM 10557]|uniref:efflux RND transporter periplasmic adaptor subunit n=1 Tax=Schlesneria sp. DSM 10557 TaxID=3044399 RepID=UPI0035A1AA52